MRGLDAPLVCMHVDEESGECGLRDVDMIDEMLFVLGVRPFYRGAFWDQLFDIMRRVTILAISTVTHSSCHINLNYI